MRVHLFGATSSPGCANYGLKKIANENEEELRSDVVKNHFYVKDGLRSMPTVPEVVY